MVQSLARGVPSRGVPSHAWVGVYPLAHQDPAPGCIGCRPLPEFRRTFDFGLPNLVVSYNALIMDARNAKGNPMSEMSDSEAQEIYDKLADDSAMDELAMALEPGTTVAFPDGIVVHRYDGGWEYQDEVEPYSPNGSPETQEQAFRRLLGG